jgi:U3 small nucleolar RNA-associated protein 13
MMYKRVQTLPMYENIEAIKILPNFNYAQSIVRKDIVIATAGSKGMIRIWKSKRTISDDVLGPIAGLVHVLDQDKSTAYGEEKGGYTGLLLSSFQQELHEKDDTRENLMNTNELIAIDAEHNISFLSLIKTSEPEKGSDTVLGLRRTIIGHNDEILDLKIIPSHGKTTESIESRKVAVATNSSQVRIFELGTFSCSVLNGHTDTVLSLDVSPCGRYVTSSGKDQTMRIWSVDSLKCVAVATGHTEAVGATSFSRKSVRFDVSGKAAKNGAGSFAVTASKDKTLKRWNLPGSAVLDHIASSDEPAVELEVFCSTRAHEKDINIVAVAPNDSLIATGSQDKTVKIWNSNDLGLVGTLQGHKRGIWDCQFSNHDRVLATCSGDKTVKLWSLSDYSCLRTFQGHAAAALRVRFLSGGLQLMSCDSEGLLRLWTIRSNECIFTIDAHDDRVWAMDIENDLLVSGGADSRLKVFTDSTKELEEQTKKEEEANILNEQKLANHLRHKEYEQALELALEMNKPRQVLKVFSTIIENHLSSGLDPMVVMQKHVNTWSTKRVHQILQYCRDWNTRSRNCHVSMLIIQAVLKTKSASELACIEGLPELFSGIAPYAERHLERIDKLLTDSFLIDFCLQSMGELSLSDIQDFSEWEKTSKFVLPPMKIDGRVQIGGADLVGFKPGEHCEKDDDDNSTVASELVTLGASSSESDDSEDDSAE